MASAIAKRSIQVRCHAILLRTAIPLRRMKEHVACRAILRVIRAAMPDKRRARSPGRRLAVRVEPKREVTRAAQRQVRVEIKPAETLEVIQKVRFPVVHRVRQAARKAAVPPAPRVAVPMDHKVADQMVPKAVAPTVRRGHRIIPEVQTVQEDRQRVAHQRNKSMHVWIAAIR